MRRWRHQIRPLQADAQTGIEKSAFHRDAAPMIAGSCDAREKHGENRNNCNIFCLLQVLFWITSPEVSFC
jgi:hypothetical protein